MAAGRLVGAVRRSADWLLVLALVGLGEGEVWLGWHADQVLSLRPADGILIVILALPLVARRTAPVLVLAAVYVISGVSTVLVHANSQPPLTQLLVILIACYSVAAYTSRRHIWLAAVVLLLPQATRLVGTIGSHRPPGDVLAVWIFVSLALAAGWVMRRQRNLSSMLQGYAQRVDREQDEKSRLAVVEERARIARELHDVVAHSVSLMVLQAGAARQSLDWEPGRALEPLLAIERTGREALAELRRLLGIVHTSEDPDQLAPQPGLDQLSGLVEKVHTAGVEVDLRIEGEPYGLPRGLDLSAYRIVQEALTNTVKHAAPCRAQVAIRYRKRELVLEIVDDGAHLAAHSSGEPNSGHGLVGMRERTALYHGSLEAGPGNGNGYRVVARIPVEANNA